jgi:hypothetical protein
MYFRIVSVEAFPVEQTKYPSDQNVFYVALASIYNGLNDYISFSFSKYIIYDLNKYFLLSK